MADKPTSTDNTQASRPPAVSPPMTPKAQRAAMWEAFDKAGSSPARVNDLPPGAFFR